MPQVYSAPLRRRYFAPLVSGASLFIVLVWIGLIIFSFLVAYFTQSKLPFYSMFWTAAWHMFHLFVVFFLENRIRSTHLQSGMSAFKGTQNLTDWICFPGDSTVFLRSMGQGKLLQ
jgi:hypothetical protein